MGVGGWGCGGKGETLMKSVSLVKDDISHTYGVRAGRERKIRRGGLYGEKKGNVAAYNKIQLVGVGGGGGGVRVFMNKTSLSDGSRDKLLFRHEGRKSMP